MNNAIINRWNILVLSHLIWRINIEPDEQFTVPIEYKNAGKLRSCAAKHTNMAVIEAMLMTAWRQSILGNDKAH